MAKSGEGKVDVLQLLEMLLLYFLGFIDFFRACQIAQVDLHSLNSDGCTLNVLFDGNIYSIRS